MKHAEAAMQRLSKMTATHTVLRVINIMEEKIKNLIARQLSSPKLRPRITKQRKRYTRKVKFKSSKAEISQQTQQGILAIKLVVVDILLLIIKMANLLRLKRATKIKILVLLVKVQSYHSLDKTYKAKVRDCL